MAADKLRQVFSPRDEKLFPLQIGEVHVRQGDPVEAGTLLMTLKTATGKTLAMRSPLAGKIAVLAAGAGDSLASPRALVSINEEVAAAAESQPEPKPEPQPTPSPGPAEAPRASSPDAPANAPTAAAPSAEKPKRSLRKPLIAAATVAAIAAAGYALIENNRPRDIRSMASATRTTPTERPRTTTGAGAAVARPSVQQPKTYSGPLSKAVMKQRDVSATGLGWRDDGGFTGHGSIRVDFPNGRMEQCAAVLISNRYVAVTRYCAELNLRSHSKQDGMKITFETYRPVTTSDGRGGRQDIRGFWRVWRVSASAMHFWPRPVDGAESLIALVELSEPAPSEIGAAGFWRFSENAAPPFAVLRNQSFLEPDKFFYRGVSCRYWMSKPADVPTSSKPTLLRIDPDCEEAKELTSGTLRVPYTDGKTYFTGFFFSIESKGNEKETLAATFSKADDAILSGGKKGNLPPGYVTLTVSGRLEKSRGTGILLSNPCTSEREFVLIASDRSKREKRQWEYRLRPGATSWADMSLDSRFESFGLNQAGSGRSAGTERIKFKGSNYNLVPFNNKADVSIMATASCN